MLQEEIVLIKHNKLQSCWSDVAAGRAGVSSCSRVRRGLARRSHFVSTTTVHTASFCARVCDDKDVVSVARFPAVAR